MSRKKKFETVTFAELLAANEEVYEPERKTPSLVLKYISSLLVLSVVAGVLMAVPSVFALNATVTAATPAVELWKELPEDIGEVAIAGRNTLYDKNGNVFATVWSENRVPLESLDNLSSNAVDALIATEDQHFYENHGVDYKGVARAALTGVGGGSGITQQLVKNLQFYNKAGTEEQKAQSTERTIYRKLRELKLAINYENTHTKEEILLQYFNTVAFGSPNIYGIETAARYFFGVSSKDLTLAQAAALVGTVQNPSLYNMDDDNKKENWKSRQEHVLNRMLSTGKITQEQYDAAKAEELTLLRQKTAGSCLESEFPFYCEHVLSELREDPQIGSTQEERDAILARGGLNIYTYLDPDATRIAQSYLDSAFGRDNRVVAPVAVVEPGTGGLAVMAVNRGYGTGPGETTYDVPSNPTGTGSSYKMFTLATALENGWDEDSLVFGSRCPLIDSRFDTPAGGIKNSLGCGGKQSQVLDYKHATAYSSNTWFAELIAKVGVNKVKDLSRKLGLSAPDSIGARSLSYTLGTTPNSPVAMAAAYATFANNGVFCPATSVRDVSYSDGSRIPVPDDYNPATKSCRRVVSPHTASVVLKAMRANVSGEIPDAFGVHDGIPGHDNAAKSGTNQLYNISWAQVTAQYSMFTNVYDMDKLTNEIETIRYKGRLTPWYNNSATDAGHNILTQILANQPNKPLNFDSEDRTSKEVPVSDRGFVTVPSLIGLEPEKALKVLETRGLVGKIDINEVDSPNKLFDPGVVVSQSVEAGTMLSVSTKREIILQVSKS